MRILELRAQNYGVFSQRRFALGNGGFVLVRGPNEAGKSTLLQLLRDALFGFPSRSDYSFNGGTMQAEVDAVLHDGRRLRFKRRKGRSQTVEGSLEPGGGPVDDAALKELLSHATQPLYKNVFAFSLTELSQGEESFVESGQPLNEALSGGLRGLNRLSQVKRGLTEEHSALFKSSGRVPPINKLATEIKEKRKKLKELCVKPARYHELNAEREQVEEAFSQRQQTQRALAGELAHLDRLDKAWEHFRAREDALRELAEVDPAADFRPGDLARYEALAASLVESTAEHERHVSELAAARDRRAALKFDPALLAREAEIRSLEQDIGKVEGYLRDLPLRQQDLKEAQKRVAEVIRDIHPDWTFAQVAALRLSLDQHARVRELAERQEQLARDLRECRSERDDLTARIARQQQRQESFPEEHACQEIDQVMAGHGEFTAARAAVREAKKRLQTIDRELEQQAQRLAAVPGVDPAALAQLQPPLAQQIEEFRERLAACEQARTAVGRRHHDAQEQVWLTDGRIRTLESAGALPDQEALHAARQRRDEGWRLIRRRYIDNQPCDAEIAAWLGNPLATLPEAFYDALRSTDELADDRQRQADKVAQKETLLAERQRQAERVDQLAEELRLAEAQAHEEREAWQALWSPTGIAPAPPAAMLEWLRVWEAWRQRTLERGEVEHQLQEAQEAWDAFEARLREATGVADQPIDRVVHVARERSDAAKNQHGQRQAVIQELEENRVLLRNLEQKEKQLTTQENEWRRDWKQLLEQLNLPRDWQPAAIVHLLSKLEQVFADQRSADDLGHRVDSMTKERDAFDQAAARLARELAPAAVPLPMVERVRALARDWQAAASAQAEAQGLDRDVDRLEREIASLAERCRKTAAERDALLATAGAADEAAFRRLAAAAERREKLLEEIRSAERALAVAREHEDQSEFHAALQTLNRDELRAQRERLAVDADEAQRQLEQLHAVRARLDVEQQALHQEGEALAMQQALETQRGELSEKVDRWGALVLAERLLDKAIEQFQREQQDDVLGEARRLFRQLTHGRHVDIRLDAGDAFQLVDQHGVERAPAQLSRGTQEQLYLAFRLAYARNYCREHEPLPFVLDDVLVNFDPQRASDTIAALAELSSEMQIIFLTCHDSTVELVREQAGDCMLLDLTHPAETTPV